MTKFSTLFCAAALAVFATAAFADDPAIPLNGISNFCSPTPSAWCSSEQQATDSSTGLTTVQYIFNSQVVPDVAADWSGWVEGTEGVNNKEATLLHFVVIPAVTGPGAHPTEYGVFLYCGGYSAAPGVGICTANNDVLPVSENPSAKFNMSGSYIPDSSGDSGTKPGSGQYAPGTAIQYSLLTSTEAPGGGLVGTTVPEPSGVVLLGIMMVGVAGFARRKFSARG
jgi:hypothetical protein